jgi:hypothetical protein
MFKELATIAALDCTTELNNAKYSQLSSHYAPVEFDRSAPTLKPLAYTRVKEVPLPSTIRNRRVSDGRI